MTSKTTRKGPELRKMTFDYSKTARWAINRQSSLNKLLELPGIYRGSDGRFVTKSTSVNTTHRSKTK